MKLMDVMTELAKMATLEGGGKHGAGEEWFASFGELQEMVVGIVPIVGKLVKVAEAAAGLTLHLGKNARLTHEYLCALKQSVAALEASP